MPVERRSGSKQVTSIAIGVVAVVVAVVAAWGMIRLASGGDGPVQVRLGDDVFDAGQAVRLSKQVAEDGPLLFSDVSGRGQLQPIVVNHFGDDPDRSAGWRCPPWPRGRPRAASSPGTRTRNLFEERAAEEGAGRRRR